MDFRIFHPAQRRTRARLRRYSAQPHTHVTTAPYAVVPSSELKPLARTVGMRVTLESEWLGAKGTWPSPITDTSMGEDAPLKYFIRRASLSFAGPGVAPASFKSAEASGL